MDLQKCNFMNRAMQNTTIKCKLINIVHSSNYGILLKREREASNLLKTYAKMKIIHKQTIYFRVQNRQNVRVTGSLSVVDNCMYL